MLVTNWTTGMVGQVQDLNYGPVNIFSEIPIELQSAITNFTSTVDVSVYINRVIARYLLTGGCRIYFPAGLYILANTLNLANANQITMEGEGGIDLHYAANSGTVFKYTGVGANDIVTMTDHHNVYWKDIQVVYNSNLFTGMFFNLASTASTGNGSRFDRIACYQVGNNGHTAAQCWYFRNNVDVVWDQCYSAHANYGWIGQFTGEVGVETNQIKIHNCTSISLKSAAIVNPFAGWTIVAHNFELSDTNTPCGLLSSLTMIQNVTLYMATFADATVAGTWISIVDAKNFNMIGGGVFGVAPGPAITGISIGSAGSFGINIIGVEWGPLNIGINFTGAVTGGMITGNDFENVTTPISGGSNLNAGYIIAANSPNTLFNPNRFIESNVALGSAVGLGTGATDNITSITVPAGQWELSGDIWFNPNAATNVTIHQGAISVTSSVLPTPPNTGAQFKSIFIAGQVPGSIFGQSVGAMRVNLAAPTIYYLVAQANFTINTLAAYGYMKAERLI